MRRFGILLLAAVALTSANGDEPANKPTTLTAPPNICPLWPIDDLGGGNYLYYAEYRSAALTCEDPPDAAYLIGNYFAPAFCDSEHCEAAKIKLKDRLDKGEKLDEIEYEGLDRYAPKDHNPVERVPEEVPGNEGFGFDARSEKVRRLLTRDGAEVRVNFPLYWSFTASEGGEAAYFEVNVLKITTDDAERSNRYLLIGKELNPGRISSIDFDDIKRIPGVEVKALNGLGGEVDDLEHAYRVRGPVLRGRGYVGNISALLLLKKG